MSSQEQSRPLTQGNIPHHSGGGEKGCRCPLSALSGLVSQAQGRKKLLWSLFFASSLLLSPLRRTALILLASLLWARGASTGVDKLERRGMPRWLSALLVIGAGAAVVVLGAICVSLAIFSALEKGVCSLPEMDTLFSALRRLTAHLPDGLGALAAQSITVLEQRSAQLASQLTLRAAGLSARLLARVPERMLFLFILTLGAYYAATDYPHIRSCLDALLPEDWKHFVRRSFHALRRGFRRWLVLQGRLMLLQFLVLTLGFTLLGRRAAGGLAALTALADALPLLGTGVILLPLALLSLLEGNCATAALYWGLCLCCALLRTVLEPRLLGRQALISPYFTLLALYLGLQCLGVGGMIAAGVAASALGLAREGKCQGNNI